MADRSTTWDLSKLLDVMGVKGGEVPRLAGSALQPVVIAADFSRTQSPEAVEGRGFVGASITMPAQYMMGWYLFSQSRGGMVLERLSLQATSIGESTPGPDGDAVSVFGSASAAYTLGSWILAVRQISPWDWGHDGASPMPKLPGNIPGQPYDVMNLGGVPVESRLYGLRYTQPFRPWADTWSVGPFPYWDPFGWAPGAGNTAGWDAVLAPVSELAPEVRWWIPPGWGLSIVNTSFQGTGDPTPTAGAIQALWREPPASVYGT